MPVTIAFAAPLPIGADPLGLKKLGLGKAHGVIFPLSGGGDAENAARVAKLGKAIKREQKLHKVCELKFTQGPHAFKEAAKTYLSSKRCLLDALFKDNARRPLEDRSSLEELVALTNKYDILKDLSEPARVWQQPKKSGKGMRVICSFGPVARAAQQMVKKLLRLTYKPQDFQFAMLTFAEKVQLAMTIIKEKGYAHVTEIDIRDFFVSFTDEAVMKALPLPKEAIRQIVMSANASWTPQPHYAHYGHISSPPGIPQGSASSAAVADWCIANMPLAMLDGSAVINHADNFFAISASSGDAADVSKALSSGIAGLPGGDFLGKLVQATEVKNGFQMLGCWVSLSKSGELEADPTDANIKDLRERVQRWRQRVDGRLKAAAESHSKQLRIKGLQDYLRFESMVQGWVQAFDFCGLISQDVKAHYDFDLGRLRNIFQITDAELKPLKDASVVIKIKWYSGG